jgi:hypothetical protein
MKKRNLISAIMTIVIGLNQILCSKPEDIGVVKQEKKTEQKPPAPSSGVVEAAISYIDAPINKVCDF